MKKNKENHFRNYVNYPYRNCCGGGLNAVEAEVVAQEEKKLGDNAKKLAFGVVLLVGLVVTSTYVYNRWLKK